MIFFADAAFFLNLIDDDCSAATKYIIPPNSGIPSISSAHASLYAGFLLVFIMTTTTMTLSTLKTALTAIHLFPSAAMPAMNTTTCKTAKKAAVISRPVKLFRYLFFRPLPPLLHILYHI